MFLAETDSINWNAVNGIAAMLGLAVALVIAFSKRSQDRNVTINPDMATKHEVQGVKDEIDKHTVWDVGEHKELFRLIAENKKETDKQAIIDRAAIERAASERSAGIYKKIDDVRKELQESLTDQTRELREDINNMPSQVIATLRNTKVIE